MKIAYRLVAVLVTLMVGVTTLVGAQEPDPIDLDTFETFESENGFIKLLYPPDWTPTEESGIVSLGNSEAVVERIYGGETPLDGDIFMTFVLLPADLLEVMEIPTDDPIVLTEGIFDLLMAESVNADVEVSEAEVVELDEETAFTQITLLGKESEGLILVFSPLEDVVGVVILSTYVGGVEAFSPELIYAIVDNFEFLGTPDDLMNLPQ